MFHERRQKQGESVDSYAQDLKSLFHKAYPQVQQGGEIAESMGKTVLVSQFVAGLLPVLKTKVAGVDGKFDEILVKARFEEAKLRDLKPLPSTDKPDSRPIPSVGSDSGGVPPRPTLGQNRSFKCTKCGGTNHTAKYCRWRGRASPRACRALTITHRTRW